MKLSEMRHDSPHGSVLSLLLAIWPSRITTTHCPTECVFVTFSANLSMENTVGKSLPSTFQKPYEIYNRSREVNTATAKTKLSEGVVLIALWLDKHLGKTPNTRVTTWTPPVCHSFEHTEVHLRGKYCVLYLILLSYHTLCSLCLMPHTHTRTHAQKQKQKQKNKSIIKIRG